MDKIGKIRRARYREGLSIRGISWDLSVSRVTVRKVLALDAPEFVYERRTQIRPKILPLQSEPEGILEENLSLPKRGRASVKRRRERWKRLQDRADPRKLVFIGKIWIKTNMSPKHVWDPKLCRAQHRQNAHSVAGYVVDQDIVFVGDKFSGVWSDVRLF